MSAKLKELQDFFRLPDGQELFYRIYRPPRVKGILVLVHGLGEHCGRYEDFSRYLARKGWGVYLYDQRGHGKTPGLRSYVNDFEDLVTDLHAFIRFAQSKENDQKTFLFAHSFGGQVCINFLAQHPRMVNGAVLSSPNIRLAIQVPWIKRVLCRWTSILLPSLNIPHDVNPKNISHDKGVVEAYKNDRLVQNKMSLRLGTVLLENLDIIGDLAHKIKLPCLLFHGSEDKITCPKGTEEFFENIRSKDRELIIYPGLFHETLNEIGKEKVYQDVAEWLEERL